MMQKRNSTMAKPAIVEEKVATAESTEYDQQDYVYRSHGG